MVTTRSSAGDNPVETDPLATIAAKLDALDDLRDKVAALEVQSRANQSKKGRQWADDADDDAEFHRSRTPYAKIEFPRFSGGDPRGWVLKAEKFFRYYAVPEEEKVEVAAMYLEGDALDLFSWINAEHTILYWAELVRSLNEHFGPPEYLNPDEHLCGIRQTGSVQEYRQEWARRAARVTNWPEHCLLGVFVNGLREELKTEVRIHKPRSIFRAASLALEFEKKMAHGKGTRPNPYSYQNRLASSVINNSARDKEIILGNSSTTSYSSSSSTTPNRAANQLTPTTRPWDATRQQRCDKGLCFRCGDLFRPGHRCSTSFSLLEIDEDGHPTQNPLEPVEEAELEPPEDAEISFNAILGRPIATTMKLCGSLAEKEVLLLVDSGSTHNFISDSLVHDLKLAASSISNFGVQIGDGSVVRCNRVCKEVQVHLPGLTITQDFYPFSLVGSDLVLGIKWLASLNTIQANWNEMFLIFWVNGKKYKLQGVPRKENQGASLNVMATVQPKLLPHSHDPGNLGGLLVEFDAVFDDPGLYPHLGNITMPLPLFMALRPQTGGRIDTPTSRRMKLKDKSRISSKRVLFDQVTALLLVQFCWLKSKMIRGECVWTIGR